MPFCNTNVIQTQTKCNTKMKIPTINFIFDRRKTATPNKKGYVELRITYNRKQKFASTGITCYPNQWNVKNECVINSSDSDELNAILIKLRQKTLQIIGKMTENGLYDINAIPTILKQESVDITFVDYVYRRIQKKKVSENTHRTYITMYNKLVEYGKLTYFSDITQKNIRNFSEWLHNYSWNEKDKYGKTIKRTYSQASIYKITSNVSLFISDAVVDGYINENPYVTKRMNESKGGTRIDEYLTIEEVGKIEKSVMPTKSLAEARDLFLIQCYTGLSYIDLMTYDFTTIKDTKGMKLCTGKRVKTGVEFAFVVTDKIREILSKYKYIIPKVPNQKYNIKLKLIADASSIDKNITSHMGRRTAGSIWLNSGIPIEVVSKCLGHSSIAMTQRAYAKILDTTIIDAFNKNIKELVKPT